ncbi:MAG: tunicamycin resistance protein [Bogoriella megaspora]|nr:MAG: tunicamycin resistance protein [Bogoriella megaspora]
MSTSLSRTETLSLFSLFAACVGILANTFHGDGEPLIASIAFSGIAFSSTYALIRWLGDVFIRAGLKGKDMSKKNAPVIPETMGAVCAVVYLLIVIVFIPFPFYKDIVVATSGGGNRDFIVEAHQVETGRYLHRFPHSKLASYLSAILSLQSVVILGLGDDLFDIRWRHKVLIPAFASIPMLIVYFVDFGVTQIVVPTFLRPYFGELLDLGWLYYAYLASISIFCPNSINILAGINGLEVSQSLIIAFLLILNDLLYILPGTFSPSNATTQHPAADSHFFSLYYLLPFLGVSLALWTHNWYPARVFVGDTYCYFAGMVFAVVSIQGHFSKTLLLLLGPQIVNFVYSLPQLFHIVPCPRHRLPRFNARTGLLEPSVADFRQKPLRPGVNAVVKLMGRLGLLKIDEDEEGKVLESNNFTIINLWLVWFGPMREDRLALGLLGTQLVCGLFGLWVRHSLALLVFTADNWSLNSKV